MKRIGLFLVICCSSLHAMKKVATFVVFLKPHTSGIKRYSVYTESCNRFSCKTLDDILDGYEQAGDTFIADLFDTSYGHVNHVKRLVAAELERCRHKGSAPDKALFDIIKVMAMCQRNLECEELDKAQKHSREHISEY